MGILRKQISRTVKDNVETIVNEHIEKELLTENERLALIEDFDDWEEAMYLGIYYDLNDKLACIDLQLLYDGLIDWVNDDENKDCSNFEVFKEIIKKIEPWRDYELWF